MNKKNTSNVIYMERGFIRRVLSKLFFESSPTSGRNEKGIEMPIWSNNSLVTQNKPCVDKDGQAAETISDGGGAHAALPQDNIDFANTDDLDDGSTDDPHAEGRTPEKGMIEEKGVIKDDVEEADFYIEQELLTDANILLDDLLERVPNHPLVNAKLADLKSLKRKAASEIPHLDMDTSSCWANQSTTSKASDRDSDAHCSRGIAYRDMGRIDEAISEFKIAMRSGNKQVLHHILIGLCYRKQEWVLEAIKHFIQGLHVDGITTRETNALYFELGQSYEYLNDFREAHYYYSKVIKADPQFLDVSKRLEVMENTLKTAIYRCG